MSKALKEVVERLSEVLEPKFRGRLIDRGLARGLVWEDGVLPTEASTFSETLTEDLQDYAFAVLSMGLQVRLQSPTHELLERAFVVAGEALESAIHRGKPSASQGFYRVTAAVAFHLARYSARAFSILPKHDEASNLSPAEAALVHLLRRKFDDLHGTYSNWLLERENHDEQIAARLEKDEEFVREDAIQLILTSSFMRGIAMFDHAVGTGHAESAAKAKELLLLTAQSSSEFCMVNHWWTATLAAHLVDEIWGLSFHQQLPILTGGSGYTKWNQLRENYIRRLRASARSAIELWPSQLNAAKRAIDGEDDLVVALPTSAGKTRIAELCIIRCLSERKRVVYITPLRALSAQIERDLAQTFVPLGFQVTSLYGSAGIQSVDSDTLRKGIIVVATPEKLDFALRNDSSIIEDVGLIVFDEGHMLGKGEREVRYETLVQRILKRSDANERRVVCLSALFPRPEDMKDLVEWIRQDAPGEPVHSTWRPTRQRFGTVEANSHGGGRLEILVGEEKPFVPRFVDQVAAPIGQRRKRPFPSNNHELTIATAWKFISRGKKVLVYCAMKKSVEGFGREILDLLERGFIKPLVCDSDRLRNARSIGEEWLGTSHPAVECLKFGVALHHGGLPRQFLNEVEELLKDGLCKLTVASPTLAQGLNLSASVLLVPSIWRNGDIVPTSEFANVAGRAGRAFVDLEGLILHVIWDRPTKRRSEWESLVKEAKAPMLKSGILQLTVDILFQVASAASVNLMDVIEYVTGNDLAWDYSSIEHDENAPDMETWERDLASLDAALLGMMDLDCASADIPAVIRESLEGSLFWRQGEELKEEHFDLILKFLASRAGKIWAQSEEPKRRGFYFAGIGLKTGLLIDSNLENLLGFLYYGEQSILSGDLKKAIEYTIGFAEFIFEIAPFQPYKSLPNEWKDGLRLWLSGEPSAAVIQKCGNEGVEFLQDGICYRLSWALEAVRVYCLSVGRIAEDQLTGILAVGVESGSLNQTILTLVRNGLTSREAACSAVESTSAVFDDVDGMMAWLRSEQVAELSKADNWPTVNSRYAWLKFFQDGDHKIIRRWTKAQYRIDVEWTDEPVQDGMPVVFEGPEEPGKGCRVLSPDYRLLGETEFEIDLEHLVYARVEDDADGIFLEYYGPGVEQ